MGCAVEHAIGVVAASLLATVANAWGACVAGERGLAILVGGASSHAHLASVAGEVQASCAFFADRVGVCALFSFKSEDTGLASSVDALQALGRVAQDRWCRLFGAVCASGCGELDDCALVVQAREFGGTASVTDEAFGEVAGLGVPEGIYADVEPIGARTPAQQTAFFAAVAVGAAEVGASCAVLQTDRLEGIDAHTTQACDTIFARGDQRPGPADLVEPFCRLWFRGFLPAASVVWWPSIVWSSAIFRGDDLFCFGRTCIPALSLVIPVFGVQRRTATHVLCTIPRGVAGTSLDHDPPKGSAFFEFVAARSSAAVCVACAGLVGEGASIACALSCEFGSGGGFPVFRRSFVLAAFVLAAAVLLLRDSIGLRAIRVFLVVEACASLGKEADFALEALALAARKVRWAVGVGIASAVLFLALRGLSCRTTVVSCLAAILIRKALRTDERELANCRTIGLLGVFCGGTIGLFVDRAGAIRDGVFFACGVLRGPTLREHVRADAFVGADVALQDAEIFYAGVPLCGGARAP